MACHYRIAVPSAKVGLPEVLIGILPGGGGTQRLPRLVGAQTALDMITSGRHVPAPEAAKLGIIDEVLPEGANLRAEAVAYARKIADKRPLPMRARQAGHRRTRHLRRHAQIHRPQGPQPEGALQLHRRRRGRLHPAVRPRHPARSRTLRRTGNVGRGQGPALRLLRRARGRQAARPAHHHRPARLQGPRRHRRRHHGRRHRHVLRRLRLRREDHGRHPGSPRSRHGAHPQQLRHLRQARQPRRGRNAPPPRPHPSRRRPTTTSRTATSSSKRCSSVWT